MSAARQCFKRYSAHNMKGVQFIVDEGGRKKAAVIDLKKHSESWEDFYERSSSR